MDSLHDDADQPRIKSENLQHNLGGDSTDKMVSAALLNLKNTVDKPDFERECDLTSTSDVSMPSRPKTFTNAFMCSGPEHGAPDISSDEPRQEPSNAHLGEDEIIVVAEISPQDTVVLREDEAAGSLFVAVPLVQPELEHCVHGVEGGTPKEQRTKRRKTIDQGGLNINPPNEHDDINDLRSDTAEGMGNEGEIAKVPEFVTVVNAPLAPQRKLPSKKRKQREKSKATSGLNRKGKNVIRERGDRKCKVSNSSSMSRVSKQVKFGATTVVESQAIQDRTFPTRMSPKRLISLLDCLNPAQEAAIKEMGFGGFLRLRIKQLPGSLCKWLVDQFDPDNMTLALGNNRQIRVTVKDVYLTLGIPYGSLPIEEVLSEKEGDKQFQDVLKEWRAEWGLEKGTPKVSLMPDFIINRADAGKSFRRNFILFIVATFFRGNQQRYCTSVFLKNVIDIDNIKSLNWCQYTIDRLIDATRKKRRAPSQGFEGPIIFLLMLYFDRVVQSIRLEKRGWPTMYAWMPDLINRRLEMLKTEDSFGKGKLEDALDMYNMKAINPGSSTESNLTSQLECYPMDSCGGSLHDANQPRTESENLQHDVGGDSMDKMVSAVLLNLKNTVDKPDSVSLDKRANERECDLISTSDVSMPSRTKTCANAFIHGTPDISSDEPSQEPSNTHLREDEIIVVAEISPQDTVVLREDEATRSLFVAVPLVQPELEHCVHGFEGSTPKEQEKKRRKTITQEGLNIIPPNDIDCIISDNSVTEGRGNEGEVAKVPESVTIVNTPPARECKLPSKKRKQREKSKIVSREHGNRKCKANNSTPISKVSKQVKFDATTTVESQAIQDRTFPTRMSPKRLISLLDRLNPAQEEAIKEMGFGGFLRLRIKQLPGSLCKWLVDQFDPDNMTLALGDGRQIRVTVKDVYLTLGIPYGSLPIEEVLSEKEGDEQFQDVLKEWRAEWGLAKGTPKVSLMPDFIINRVDAGMSFRRNFILFIVATFFRGNQQRYCTSVFVKNVIDIDNIKSLNWCQYTIDRLIDATRKKRQAPSQGFEGPIIFLLMLYFDRVVPPIRLEKRGWPTMYAWTPDIIDRRLEMLKTEDSFGKGRLEDPLDMYNMEAIDPESSTESNLVMQLEDDIRLLGKYFQDLLDAKLKLSRHIRQMEEKYSGRGDLSSLRDQATSMLSGLFGLRTDGDRPSRI